MLVADLLNIDFVLSKSFFDSFPKFLELILLKNHIKAELVQILFFDIAENIKIIDTRFFPIHRFFNETFLEDFDVSASHLNLVIDFFDKEFINIRKVYFDLPS